MKKTFFALLSAWLMILLLSACGGGAPAEETKEPEAAEATEVEARKEEKNTSAVAGAEDMTTVEDVEEEGMVPVYANSLKDGVYPVEMKSSSSMFKADHVELAVEGGSMEAVLYMTSDSYAYMFDGTAAEAAAADTAEYILMAVDDAAGEKTFTLPVEALDTGLSFAAFSVRKELWYDRTLLFRSDSLPAEAFADGVLVTPESLELEDGEYTIEVSLTGGSGKASVTSPARLTVADGAFFAAIEWSSANYDYMKIGEEQYLPVNTEGNSVFEIPVTVLDSPMAVIADTTAMSQPYEIEYSLLFSADSIEAVS